MSTSRWNILEELDSEKEINDFVDSIIEDEDVDASLIINALADAAKARVINHITKTTGIDRKLLCDMFLEDANTKPQLDNKAVVKAAKAFLEPVHA